MQIRQVDPFDDAAFEAWHAVYLAADVHGREKTATPWQLEELRVEMQSENAGRWTAAYLGRDRDEVVVVGSIAMPLLDNRDRAEIGVHTLPERRRRGHGTAMLAHLEAVARARGRSILGAEASWAHDAGVDGRGSPGADFLVRRGFLLGLGDVQRVLDLPVADELLDRLAREAAPHHAAYTLRSWVGPVPDDIVVSHQQLEASLMTEAPMGELDIEPETVDVGLLRQREQTLARQGRTKYNTVALDAQGTVVAYTDAVTTIHEPGRVYQWGTHVRGADRGHRLGLAVKVANLRLLQAERHDVRRMITYNAEVNTPMIGVNVRLGFRPGERLGEFQKRLPQTGVV